jgi:hypothetical protein
MALAQNVNNITWGGGNLTATLLSNVFQESDVFDVLAAPATGVAIGLAIQVDCVFSAHARLDLIEVLSSFNGTVWDTTGNAYASNSLQGIATNGLHGGVTVPLAYAEDMRYFKVRITPPLVAGSSYIYTLTCNKVTA